MSKTVVQLNFSGAWGGLEMSSFKIARHFHNRGFTSIVVTSAASPLGKATREAGIQTLELPGGHHFSPKTSLLLRKFLRKNSVDVIMVHQLRNLWILQPALWGLSNIRVIGFARMFLNGISKNDLLHRHLYSRLEKMVALSHLQKEALLPCLPVPIEKYVVIPNGVDGDRFNPKHRSEAVRTHEFKAGVRDKVVGVIGRLDQQKGQCEFVEAAAILLREFPGTRFVLVGSESVGETGFERRLKDLVASKGIGESVHFLGHRTDTPVLAASFDVSVLPSYEENFGNVVLEAMASGQAIVATNTGGTPEQIRDGEWGLLVPPRDSGALAKAIGRYLRDEKMACAHARRALEVAGTLFPVAKIMSQIESLV